MKRPITNSRMYNNSTENNTLSHEIDPSNKPRLIIISTCMATHIRKPPLPSKSFILLLEKFLLVDHKNIWQSAKNTLVSFFHILNDH